MAAEKEIKPERRVLIVDDDRDDLATVGDSFRALSENRWQIYTAASVAEALTILAGEKIELVVLAVNSPVLEVSLLLGSLGRHLKKAVMAAAAAGDQRAASRAAGADLFVEKPVSPEGLKSVFAGLCQLLDWTTPQGFQGVLRRVGLPDLIQMECLGRNSSILELYHEHSLGRIYIENGQVIHAVCGEIFGERAFQKLLTLTGGTFELREFELPSERTINRTWEFLLGEAARQREQLNLRARSGESTFTGAEASSSEPANRAAEMLVCTSTGAVLYHWQCPDLPARVALLQTVARRAESLIPELQLGKLDRLEIQLPGGRAVLQPRADRLVFVRVTRPPAQPQT
jgi:CheY-like chemotaxis protein